MAGITSEISGRSADELREQMVATLVDKGVARSPEVIAALRSVPRHLVQGVEAERVYDPFQASVTKRDAEGLGLSSVSATHIQAIQLEQAQVRAGDRVLEIGSGGVNAAYLAELVGQSGLAVTMDIDPDVTDRATQFVADAGYQQIKVVTGDAAFGAEQFAPFDRIVVTVETTDFPQAWWDQLADDGRIVAPIRWRGQRRTVALVRQEKDVLVADDIAQAGFVPMQGISEEREQLVLLHDVPDQRVALRLDGESVTDADARALGHALREGGMPRWTNVTLAKNARFAPLDMWLATVLDTVTMTGDPGAHEAGLIPKPSPIGWPVLVEGPSMAYRTLRPTADPQLWELGVVGYGPAGEDLAERYATAITTWDPQIRPQLTVRRNGRPATTEATPGRASRSVHRRTCTLTISWP